ncbi:DUF72 domain-containing protein [Flexithrix dorotheae]|uniref:DUF72 domain-containing protein n=1 Tax=Flexithrix dorotheae TaxID=70993 RepID=UPI00036A5957|nr:DUF72 domain-containing protein [Flexithrix dorotheae]
MEFGKLQDISQVDFTLPPDPLGTQQILEKLDKQECEILIGCPAWSCKEWVGKIYPKGTKPRDFLSQYTNSFSTIELNTTYYSTPKREVIERWAEVTPDYFRFCPKISSQISHYRRLSNCNLLIQEFCDAFLPLGEKLGSMFLQLPPNFTINEAEKLINFIENFPLGYQMAVEFRHESWFRENDEFDAVCKVLESRGFLTVITDVAGRRDVLHQRLTTGNVMLRFVGNSLHDTDYTRIGYWVEKLKNWIDQGVSQVYFFVHEPEDVLCPELANFLVKELKAKALETPVSPRFLNTGIQGSLF